MERRLAGFIALLMLAACSTSERLHGDGSQGFEKVGGEFLLRRTGERNWLARTCLDRPVEAIRFERPFPGLRENSWQAPENFVLAFGDGAAELRREDGTPFECAAVNLETYTELPEKDYFAFSVFSDGGVTVYTGHLMGPVLIDGEWHETELAARYVGREGESVIVREPERLVHQFVYFGRQAPLRTEDIVAVIDPAMPRTARRAILETVPVVNRLLEETFAFKPREPYMIFMAADLDAFDGFSVKGGTQPYQIRFTLRGRGVVPMMEKEPAHFPKSTAHEVLHLWQNDHWFGRLGNDQPWVHEGGADALAFEIMRIAGVYDEAAYRQAWEAVEMDCIDALRETSVRDAAKAGRFDVVYSCGALVNRLAGEAIEKANPGEGVVKLWQTLAKRPETERRSVKSEQLYFLALEELGFSGGALSGLQAFLDFSGDGGAERVVLLRETLNREQ